MEWLLAQTDPVQTSWSAPPGSGELWLKIILITALGIGAMFGLMAAPPRVRRPVIGILTFVSGLFYVLLWIWPKAQGKAPGDIPNGTVESFSFWLQDAAGQITNLSTILTTFLLGLGAFSLLRIHVGRLVKMQKDWFYSIVMLVCMFSMIIFAYWAWYVEKFGPDKKDMAIRDNWVFATYAKDLLFDGLYQKMDAAMFSIIAFFIMSAAYRAFRVRSVEATILLSAALIMMLSLLAIIDLASNKTISSMTGGDPGHFLNNFKIGEIAGFIRAAFQQPSIRAIDFGIGIGALAMGIRLWLSLDRAGGTN